MTDQKDLRVQAEVAQLDSLADRPHFGMPAMDIGIIPTDIRLVNEDPLPVRHTTRRSPGPRLEYPVIRGHHEQLKQASLPEEFIWSFMQLADAPDSALLAFAKKYGMLNIGDSGLPKLPARIVEYEDGTRWYFEPLSDWRQYAAMMRAFLRLFMDVRQGKDGDLTDWTTILRVKPPEPYMQEGESESYYAEWQDEYGLPPPAADDHTLVAWVKEQGAGRIWSVNLSYFLRRVDLRPAVKWPGSSQKDGTWQVKGDPETYLSCRSVIGILVTQLVSVVESRVGIAACDECGQIYQPKRRPRPGEQHYCRACRENGYLSGKRASWGRHSKDGVWVSRKRKRVADDGQGAGHELM